MSLLHYPHCLLSSFFSNPPLRICFISVLFNTLREIMQACGFAGAGKQIDSPSGSTSTIFDNNISITSGNGSKIKNSSTFTNTLSSGEVKLALGKGITVGSTASVSITLPPKDHVDNVGVNGTIAATNKLITLFVMMFCVFTGDGYLQHYRCCRDNWPTTGYNKYQSFLLVTLWF